MTIRIRPSTRRPTRRLQWQVLEYVLLLAGLLGTGYYLTVWADTYVYQDYENWAFDQNLEGRTATAWGYAQHFWHSAPAAARSEEEQPVAEQENGPSLPAATVPVAATRRTAPRSPAVDSPSLFPKEQDKSLIGRIMIPRVQLTAIVREGVDNRTLRRAVGHVPGTALPGQPGNVGLAGHRDTFFLGLRSVRKNDRIEVRTLHGAYAYQVESIKIVSPKDVSVLAVSEQPVLTLVTCYPFNYVGSAPKRYIVRARQISLPDKSGDRSS